jgi:50S ribosomal subunit-associated GTPase HflX
MIQFVVAVEAIVIALLIFGLWYVWDEYQNTYEDVRELMNEFIINNGNTNEYILDIFEKEKQIDDFMAKQKIINRENDIFIEAQQKLNLSLLESEITDRFKKSKGVRK